MAARSSAVRQAAQNVPAQRQGSTRTVKGGAPSLGVVDRRQGLERAKRRQARVLLLVSGGVLAGALTLVAAGHAMLAANQLQVDGQQSLLASATAVQQNLQVERSRLETPTRVLSLAEHRFKMVAPDGVTYLQPVDPGQSVEQAHRTRDPEKRSH